MYEDVVAFLQRVENPQDRSNRRVRLSERELTELQNQNPGIPDDYLAFLGEVGSGAFRESQYMVYGALQDPSFIFGDEVVEIYDGQLFCFGDNFSGDPGGFLVNEDWAVAEIWHDDLSLNRTEQTFGDFIRDRMLLGPEGEDLRAR